MLGTDLGLPAAYECVQHSFCHPIQRDVDAELLMIAEAAGK